MSDRPDLRTTLGAAPIARDGVRVRGPEALEFLQGQLSQDVAAVPEGGSRPALLLQPTGKVLAWLRVTRFADDDLLLDVDVGWGAVVAARLTRFKLRTKVDLEPEEMRGLALRGPGALDVEPPIGALALPTAWPGVAGADLLSTGEIALAGVPLVATAALEALRIECGVPAMGTELTEDTIPAEGGQWLIDASVSFDKGCYTGQELVARIDSRGGNVPRPLRGLVLDAEVPPAAPILDGTGTAVGVVTSSATSPSLGPVALALLPRAIESGTSVLVGGGGEPVGATVRLLPLR